ncbi:LysR family transcriptional regulator [Pseudonocardia sp. ICBG601]|nr:LysR family transcriptional regulator [Pseudonocardia sp. ICBG601]
MDLTLVNLRCLLAIADRGSFTGAAAVVGLTQSAVSRNIATLERHGP